MGECGGSAEVDCAGECEGDAVADVCGECNGEETDSNNCFENNTLWVEWNINGNLDVNMYNLDAVAGFQFDLSGVTLSAASGGSAEAAGFTTSTSGATVLGFSFTGATIPVGNGLLTELTFSVNEGEFQTCLETVVISDPNANQLAFDTGDCETVISLAGCMDEAACNYSEFANEDDGSCWYAGVDNDYCDCDMNADDCAGDCGGLADYDCADECGGSAVEDCAGECNGTAVEDCAGVCEGDAVADACGECGGDAVCLQYFTDLPNETGENSLVIIQGGIDLEVGDEVGLFDSNGVLETCDPAEGCSNPVYGEILVGSGVWTGEQIDIVGIGSPVQTPEPTRISP
jgi:hypothetical protein